MGKCSVTSTTPYTDGQSYITALRDNQVAFKARHATAPARYRRARRYVSITPHRNVIGRP